MNKEWRCGKCFAIWIADHLSGQFCPSCGAAVREKMEPVTIYGIAVKDQLRLHNEVIDRLMGQVAYLDEHVAALEAQAHDRYEPIPVYANSGGDAQAVPVKSSGRDVTCYEGMDATNGYPDVSEVDFTQAIKRVINRHSAENESNTPDFVLAEFLTDCIDAFDKATNARGQWYKSNPSFLHETATGILPE